MKEVSKVCEELGVSYKEGGNLFRKKALEIKDIVAACLEYDISYKDGGTVFERSGEEIRNISKYCLEKGIKYKSGGTIFSKNLEGIKEIVEVCEKEGIDYRESATVFLRQPKEIGEIVKICKEYGIDYGDGGSAFSKKPDVLKEVIEACVEVGIEPVGVALCSKPERIRENAKYIRENYGQEYVTRMIISQNPERLREVLPYLDEFGYLVGLLNGSAGILSLSLNEIKEREKVVRREGEEVLVNGKFNPTFGQSRKKYKQRHRDIIEIVQGEEKKTSMK